MLRLPSTYEPPAEEADEAAHDNNHGDGDARNGATREVGAAIGAASTTAASLDVAGDGARVTRWRCTAHAILDTSDLVISTVLRALLAGFSSAVEIVPREAACTFRSCCGAARLTARVAGRAHPCLGINCHPVGALGALSTTFCCAHLTARLSICLVAPIIQKEVPACTRGTASLIIWCCALIGTSSTSLADAVDRILTRRAAPRAVPGASDDGPAVCAAPRTSLALVHAGAALINLSIIGVLEDFPRGAAQALVGPRCAARGALGAARLAGLTGSVTVVPAEGRAGSGALIRGGEVLTLITLRADLTVCAPVLAYFAVLGFTRCLRDARLPG